MKEKILKKMKEKEEDEKKKKERKNSLKFHFRGKSDGKNLIRNKTISNIYNNNNNNEKKFKKNLIKNKSLGSLNKEKIDKKFNLEEKKINVDNNIKKQNDNNLNNINDTNNNHNNNKKKSNNNRVHTPGKGLKKNNEKNTPKKENINKNYYLNQNDLNMNKKEEENNTQKISENLNNNNININIISSQKNDNNNINKISQENSTSINNLSTQISSINNNNNISSENNSIINNNTKSNIQNENSFINNKSNSLENQIKNIENSINELKNLYSIDELTNENFNEFILTRGASKAIELLNDKLYFKLFKNENFPNIEIIIVYKIYFQLVNKEKNIIEEKDIEIFWKKVKEYFLNKNNNNIQIGNLLENQFKQLDFSKENFVKIYNLCEGKINKLTPVYYSKICATTGLFIFLIKDALEYLGIINDKKKTQINRMYQNLCFLLEIKKKEFENEKI